MIHKIIGGKSKQKQRNIKNSIAYLLREKKQNEQQFVSVLSGDKNQLLNFNKFIINKNLKSPYVAGVLSFEEDHIEEIIKNKIMGDFEEMIFSGIPLEYRPPIMWIQHTDKGRVELNYLTFNALTTGRSYPIFYDKKDRRLFNDFSEIVNYENNFTSPFDDFSDIQKKKMTEPPGHTLPAVKKELVTLLNNRLHSLILDKKISNREDLISYLTNNEGFKINRISKNTISIVTEIDTTPIRLKGDIYQEGRNYSDYFNEKKSRPERTQEVINEKLNNHKESYKKGLKLRTERNKKTYINPIIKRSQKTKIFSPIATLGVTLHDEVKNYDIERKYTISPATENLTRINNIRKQQQTISNEIQQLDSSIEDLRSKIDEQREFTEGLSGRFNFFRKYFNRFGELFSEVFRAITETFGPQEKAEQKITKPENEKIKIERRSGSGGRYRPN